MLPVGMILAAASVMLIWGGFTGNNPVTSLISALQTGEFTASGELKVVPVVTSSRGSGGGFSPRADATNVGWTVWNQLSVASHASQLARTFGIRVGGQCRKDGVVPPGGSRNSLHFVSNGCRAVNFTGSDSNLLKLESWAKGQGEAFAEVIYSGETSYHRTGGRNNHLHLGWPTSGPKLLPRAGGGGGGSGGGSF